MNFEEMKYIFLVLINQFNMNEFKKFMMWLEKLVEEYKNNGSLAKYQIDMQIDRCCKCNDVKSVNSSAHQVNNYINENFSKRKSQLYYNNSSKISKKNLLNNNNNNGSGKLVITNGNDNDSFNDLNIDQTSEIDNKNNDLLSNNNTNDNDGLGMDENGDQGFDWNTVNESYHDDNQNESDTFNNNNNTDIDQELNLDNNQNDDYDEDNNNNNSNNKNDADNNNGSLNYIINNFSDNNHNDYSSINNNGNCNSINSNNNGGNRVKKRGKGFSALQKYELEKLFSDKKYISADERSKLAEKLDLTQVQIKDWFKNHRKLMRRSIANQQQQQHLQQIEHKFDIMNSNSRNQKPSTNNTAATSTFL